MDHDVLLRNYAIARNGAMKRLFLFGLLALFLFNLVGYYGLFMSARLYHGQTMIRLFDGGAYNVHDLDTLRLPLNVPYPLQDNGFERVDGELEYQGEFYRLVGQRFHLDEVRIVILRDPHQKKLHEALGDYVRTLTDEPASGGQPSKVRAEVSKDYVLTTTCLGSSSAGWIRSICWNNSMTADEPVFSLYIPSPPPRA